jgi:hypothetical protein
MRCSTVPQAGDTRIEASVRGADLCGADPGPAAARLRARNDEVAFGGTTSERPLENALLQSFQAFSVAGRAADPDDLTIRCSDCYDAHVPYAQLTLPNSTIFWWQ